LSSKEGLEPPPLKSTYNTEEKPSRKEEGGGEI